MPHPIDVHIGRKFREARVFRGMTQSAIGKAVGVSFQQIQKYETGANRIGGSRLWMIADELELPITFFFDGLSSKEAMPEISAAAMRTARIFHELPEGELKQQVFRLVKAVRAAG